MFTADNLIIYTADLSGSGEFVLKAGPIKSALIAASGVRNEKRNSNFVRLPNI